MRRCECGNTRFHAHQRVYMDILVDANNNFTDNETKDATSSIYDAETPYGPYTCTKCGRSYESLEELNECPDYLLQPDKLTTFKNIIDDFSDCDGFFTINSAGKTIGFLCRDENLFAQVYDVMVSERLSIFCSSISHDDLSGLILKSYQNKYVSYEDGLSGFEYTESDMKKVYRFLVDMKEYPNYECWKQDMLKSGVFVRMPV